jgi:hypothetical protein
MSSTSVCAGRLAFYTLLCVVTSTQQVWSQSVRVLVTRTQTDSAAAAAQVQLTSTSGPTFRKLTNARGYVRFDSIPSGKYQLKIDYIAHRSVLTKEFAITATDSLTYRFELQPAPFELEPLIVEAKKRRWWEAEKPPALWSFYERRSIYGAVNLGMFFDREYIDKFGTQAVESRIQAFGRTRMGCEAFRMGGGGAQTRRVMYVDGLRSYIQPDIRDVEAIEFYRSGNAPGEFAGSRAACGTIVYWTKRGN